MAAANASARGQRAAILASPLSELTGFNLTVDCLSPGCARERTFAVADLATFYGGRPDGGRSAAPDEVFWCLWRPCGRGVAGDGASVECPCQTAPRGAAGAGGAGVDHMIARRWAGGCWRSSYESMQDRRDADLDDLAETSEVGDWKMPDFKAACAYAASQGWLIVEDDVLTLTTAGLAAG